MRWCRGFFFRGGGRGVNVWAKTDLTQRKPSQRTREEARDRQRAGDIEKNTKAPFQSFQSNSLLCWHHQSETRVGEFPCYCHLLFPSLRAAKWLTFPAFSCRECQMQPESETMAAHSVTDCAFNVVCFNLEIAHSDASISSLTLPFPHAYCHIIDCTLRRVQLRRHRQSNS